MRIVLIGAAAACTRGDDDPPLDVASGAPIPESDLRPDQSGGTAAAGGDSARSSGGRDVQAALSAARAVEFPDRGASVAIDFTQDDAVFVATGTGSFVETLELTVTSAAGDTVFWQSVRTVHQTDPIGYHATVSMGGAGERWAWLASLGGQPGLARPLEVVRLADRYWTRTQESWEGPVGGEYVPYFRDGSPIRSLSRQFSPVNRQFLTSLERTSLHGRPVNHYRFEIAPSEYFVEGLWTSMTSGLDTEPLSDCCSEGEVDLWVDDQRLVLRALFRIVDREGRVFRAKVEADESDYPVSIGAPS